MQMRFVKDGDTDVICEGVEVLTVGSLLRRRAVLVANFREQTGKAYAVVGELLFPGRVCPPG